MPSSSTGPAKRAKAVSLGALVGHAGERMRVWDVLIGGETEDIERSGSRHLRQGDLLFAQICHQPEVAVFGSMSPIPILTDNKIEVIELLKTLNQKIAETSRIL